MSRDLWRHAVTAVVALALAGCATNAASSELAPVGGSRVLRSVPSGFIQHVVIVVQENRSFDNLFATFPGADGATEGLEKLASGDQEVPLKPGKLKFSNFGHRYSSFLREYDNGKMDGFNLTWRGIHGGKRLAGTYIYRYVDPKYIEPYWTIAQNYVLADHMFTTMAGGSFTAHQDLIAGGTPITPTEAVIDWPTPSSWGCNGHAGSVTSLITTDNQYLTGQGPFPCFSYKTLRDLLDGAGLSWRYFTNTSLEFVWNAFDAIEAVHNGPEWKTNIVVPNTDFFQYVQGNELPNVAWVIPDGVNSDHPGTSQDTGPSWVASIVNAVGESSYWDSTAIIVVWDDWGGEYDHVAPPQLGEGGLGFRVPMLLISPYAKETSAGQPGYVSHTQYEFGSILKFVEDNWELPRLGTSDVRASSIVDCFNFNQAPRSFTAIPTKYSKTFFLHQKPSNIPLDDE